LNRLLEGLPNVTNPGLAEQKEYLNVRVLESLQYFLDAHAMVRFDL
jgi:hypothetical protein